MIHSTSGLPNKFPMVFIRSVIFIALIRQGFWPTSGYYCRCWDQARWHTGLCWRGMCLERLGCLPEAGSAGAQEPSAGAGGPESDRCHEPAGCPGEGGILPVVGRRPDRFAREPGRWIGAVFLTDSRLFDRFGDGITPPQLISDFGRTPNLVASSRLAASAAQQTYQATRYDVLLGVNQAYFETLRSQAMVKAAQETVAARQLSAVTSGSRFLPFRPGTLDLKGRLGHPRVLCGTTLRALASLKLLAHSASLIVRNHRGRNARWQSDRRQSAAPQQEAHQTSSDCCRDCRGWACVRPDTPRRTDEPHRARNALRD